MQLKLLWDLQETDLAIRGITEDLENAPLKSGVQEITEALEALRAERDKNDDNLKADQKQMRELEMKTQKTIDTRKELYETMYGGKTVNVKELEQQQRRLEQLDNERKKLEDLIINLLESVEEQEEQLGSLNEQLQRDENELKQAEAKLAAELELLQGKMAELQARRAKQATAIDPKLLEKYRILAEKHQGRPLARVDNDICGGCRVFISGALRGHLYNPEAMVYCENCGRLLVIIED
jgi:uncharacterized protein